MRVKCSRYPDWINFDFDKPCEVHMQYPETPFYRDGVFRVFIDSTEPSSSCVHPSVLSKLAPLYDLILTKSKNVVSENKNSRLFYFGGTFVGPDPDVPKEFSVSFLATRPPWNLPNYHIRYSLWNRRDEIRIPKKFYSSSRHPVDPTAALPGDGGNSDKKILFRSMFHISTENTTEAGYFTEKLIDSLCTKTVPIYMGHRETVTSVFDEKGILFAESTDDIIRIANSCSSDIYYDMMPHIEENYKRSLEYCDDMNSRILKAICNA